MGGTRSTGADGRSDDGELVARCREGDGAAKRELLARVLPTIRGATRTILRERADADDAAQQAMLDLLGGLPGFRGDGSLTAWARTIAVRASLRLAQRHRQHASVADPEAVLAAQAAPHGDERLREQLPRTVQAYLDALPPAQRQALVLRHGLGHTVPEIAALCDESVNTIKSRLVTARKEIRRLVRQDETVGAVRRSRQPGGRP